MLVVAAWRTYVAVTEVVLTGNAKAATWQLSPARAPSRMTAARMRENENMRFMWGLGERGEEGGQSNGRVYTSSVHQLQTPNTKACSLDFQPKYHRAAIVVSLRPYTS